MSKIAPQYMRRFGGRKYFLRRVYPLKSRARWIADRARDTGERARIVEHSTGYAVYTTGKHG